MLVNTKLPLFSLILMLFGIHVSPSFAFQTKTIVVKPSDVLQESINKASEGDTLVFSSGTYTNVSLLINKELHLRGRENAVLVGADTGSIFQIVHSNVSVKNLSFQNTPISFIREYAAIEVIRSKNIHIDSNDFKDNFFAIYLSDSRQIFIENNHIKASNSRESNSGNAIHAWKSRYITIRNNTLEGHRDGVYLEFAHHVLVENNLSLNNLRYGLHFMFSDSCAYERNQFETNGAGVAVMYSKSVHMRYNTFLKNNGANTYGLLLKEIFDSEMAYNTFSDNSTAIYLEASNRVYMHHNTIKNNGWAIKLKANSISNRFEQNNFTGNVFDFATNSRQNYSTIQGNYWSQYSGYDLDNDGVGDQAYRPARLFGALIDRQPLAMLLVNSQLAQLLDWVDSIMPILTPETLKDNAPLMKPILYDTHPTSY